MIQPPSLPRKAPIEKQLVTPASGKPQVAQGHEAREIGCQESPLEHVPIQAMAMHHQHLTVPESRSFPAGTLEVGVDLGPALGRKRPR
jgi:hypothetical protein